MSEPITTEPATTPAEGPDAAAQQPKVTDWEAEARKWEKRSKDNFAKLKEAEPKLSEYERMVEAQKTDAQRQSEELNRWQSEAETWRKAAVGNRIEALASTDFADPSDAVGQLDPAKYINAGGQLDEAAIRADLAEILERKPHWRRSDPSQQGPRIPAPNPNQGNSGAAPSDPAALFGSIVRNQIGGG